VRDREQFLHRGVERLELGFRQTRFQQLLTESSEVRVNDFASHAEKIGARYGSCGELG
jgi:hypothetical protein